ncbi:tubulin delta chain-like [Liolophura sinensis]|uniref:tubulin delta chain-like n=1 Tax=Liolophura sinensis TaxID=3198878 RepID=UPI0031592E60
MSSVIVQVGQCGNQIGHHFWSKTVRDECAEKCNVYKSQDGYLRAVCIDSEPKVVGKIQRGCKVRDANVVCGKRGRGSNWALGYHGLPSKGDNHVLEDSMEALRKEIERCAHFSGTMIFHSLSGGTGSGLGSRLCEEIRDAYPMQYLLSCAVAPCTSGESPLQNYNSAFTLSWLQRYADGIILLRNDDMLQKVKKRSEQESAGFEDLNSAIAGSLCGVVLPTDTLKSSGYSLGMEPWEMVRSLCPMPSLKFMNLSHASRSKLSWEGLVSSISQGHRRRDSQGQIVRTLSTLLVARGDATSTFFRNLKTTEEKIKSAYNVVNWNPFPVDVWTAKDFPPGPRGSSSVTIAANSGCIMEFLDTVSHKAQRMFREKAYLHWYHRYGSSEADFTEAFETLARIYGDYQEAMR